MSVYFQILGFPHPRRHNLRMGDFFKILPILLSQFNLLSCFDSNRPTLESFAKSKNVRVHLVSGGKTYGNARGFYVGVFFDMKPGWHIYWKNPGETGRETSISWEGSKGGKVGTLEWPAPLLFKTNKYVSYGYKKEVMLTALLEPLPGEDTVELHAHIKWLECENVCIPGKAKLGLRIEKGDGTVSSDWAKRIVEFRNLVPRLPQDNEKTETAAHRFDVKMKGDQFLLYVGTRKNTYFYPYSKEMIDMRAPQTRDADILQVKKHSEWKDGNKLEGVLVYDGGAEIVK
jgi:DsbC/DsbD-like thiol-disulfide interchange protein